MRLVLLIFLTPELQINIIPFKVVPLGSHTPLPLPVAVLEVFVWKCPQLVCHGLLDVVHSSKWRTLMWNLSFGKRKKSHGLRSGEYGGCGTPWNTLFGQKFFYGVAVWQGIVVVMQHPIVRNLWPNRMNSFSESLKDLTIVMLINCLSLRHEFLMNNTLTVEKNILGWILFSICSFLPS